MTFCSHHHHPNLFEQAWINPQQRVRPGCPVVVADVLSMLGGLRGQFVPCQVIHGHASPTHPRSALACLGHSVPRSYALSLWLSSLCCALHGLAISFCSHEAHPQCPWYPACTGGNQSSHHPGVLHDRSIGSWHGHFFSSGNNFNSRVMLKWLLPVYGRVDASINKRPSRAIGFHSKISLTLKALRSFYKKIPTS